MHTKPRTRGMFPCTGICGSIQKKLTMSGLRCTQDPRIKHLRCHDLVIDIQLFAFVAALDDSMTRGP